MRFFFSILLPPHCGHTLLLSRGHPPRKVMVHQHRIIGRFNVDKVDEGDWQRIS